MEMKYKNMKLDDKEKFAIKNNNEKMVNYLGSNVGSNIANAFYKYIDKDFLGYEKIKTITVTPIFLDY